MLTACLMGVLILSAAVWAYKQLEAVVIPTKEWNVQVTIPSDAVNVQAAVAKAGDAVEFFSPGPSITESGPKAVTGVVKAVQATPGQNSTVLTVGDVVAVQEAAVPSRDQIVVAGALRGLVSTAGAIPYFDLLYLQATVVGIILVVGALLAYWLVGVKRGSVEFLIATDGEMKKVNWSTRKEVLGSTWVVIGACFLIAAFLFVIDYSFSAVFQLVGLLKKG